MCLHFLRAVFQRSAMNGFSPDGSVARMAGWRSWGGVRGRVVRCAGVWGRWSPQKSPTPYPRSDCLFQGYRVSLPMRASGFAAEPIGVISANAIGSRFPISGGGALQTIAQSLLRTCHVAVVFQVN